MDAITRLPDQIIKGVTGAKKEVDRAVEKVTEPVRKAEAAIIDVFVGGPQDPGDRDPNAPLPGPPVVTARDVQEAATIGAFAFVGKTAVGAAAVFVVPPPAAPVAETVGEAVGAVLGGLVGLGWNRLTR